MHDAAGRCVQIAENGSTPGYSGNAIKNFIWCGAERCEQRDNSNAVVSQYSGLGQRNSTTNYFYAFDHLGSVREVTNDGGTVQGAFGFDPYGNMTVLSGSFKPDFGFTGIYQHSRTNLALTWFRQYNPALGSWLSRDPLGENAGLNLYGYTGNSPISNTDPLGLIIRVTGGPGADAGSIQLAQQRLVNLRTMASLDPKSTSTLNTILRELDAPDVDVEIRVNNGNGAAQMYGIKGTKNSVIDFNPNLEGHFSCDSPDYGKEPLSPSDLLAHELGHSLERKQAVAHSHDLSSPAMRAGNEVRGIMGLQPRVDYGYAQMQPIPRLNLSSPFSANSFSLSTHDY